MKFRTRRSQEAHVDPEGLGPTRQVHPVVFSMIGELSGVGLWDALTQLEAWAAGEKDRWDALTWERRDRGGAGPYDSHAFAVLRAVADEADARWSRS